MSKTGFIPNYVKARNPKRLRALMLKNNSRLGGSVEYYDIQFVKGYWFAWFKSDIVIDLQNPLQGDDQ